MTSYPSFVPKKHSSAKRNIQSAKAMLWPALAGLLMLSAPLSGQRGQETPSAYSRWTHGPSQAESTFPIGVWLQSPENAARYKAAGVNFYVALWQGPTEAQLKALKAADMPVICEQNAVGLAHREDPGIIGWMHGDEPDNAQAITDPATGKQSYGPCVPPSRIVADYARIRAADPTRPILLNLGQGVANDAWIGRGAGAKLEDYATYVGGGDLISFDVYPVTGLDRADSENFLWYVPKGVDRLTKWTAGRKPVWNCIECTQIGSDRKPTPHQVRAEVWMSLIHGSKGLIYFVHQFKPAFNEHALLDDPAMLAEVTAINRGIQSLAPALNSPTIENAATVVSSAPETPIDIMVKRKGQYLYLMSALTPCLADALPNAQEVQSYRSTRHGAQKSASHPDARRDAAHGSKLLTEFRKSFERPHVPLKPAFVSSETRNGLLYEKLTVASEAGVRVPLLVVSKAGVASRRPAVVCLHGLGGNKEGFTGSLEEFARRGFVGVALDARYHGDRAGNLSQAMIDSFRTGREHPYIWDTVWDTWRVLDYLQTRRDVDRNRLGVMGISLGGHTTWMVSADPRVKAVVPCISVCSWRWQIEHEGYVQRVRNVQGAFDAVVKDMGEQTVTPRVVATAWEHWLPGIPSRWDCQDILGAMAPRPLLILGGDTDPVAPLEGTMVAFNVIEKAYARTHAADNLQMIIAAHSGHTVTAEHNRAMYAWFERWLTPIQ